MLRRPPAGSASSGGAEWIAPTAHAEEDDWPSGGKAQDVSIQRDHDERPLHVTAEPPPCQDREVAIGEDDTTGEEESNGDDDETPDPRCVLGAEGRGAKHGPVGAGATLAHVGSGSKQGMPAVPIIPIKHHLQHTWRLWALLHSQSTKENWQESQMIVHTFSSVEDFWRLFNNIRQPSQLGSIDFSLFKKDITPAWEDEACEGGGRWIAKLEKSKPVNFDGLWMDLVLAVIGENFENIGGQCIVGVVFAWRPKNISKVAVWLSEREEEKVMPIGHAFRRLLQARSFSSDPIFEDFKDGPKLLFTLRDT